MLTDGLTCEYGRETHRQWLERFLELPGGLPARDTLRRTLSRIDPKAFQKALLKWLKGFENSLATSLLLMEKLFADRRLVESSRCTLSVPGRAISICSLGQTTVDQKSNEITAIPQLLESLILSGAIVTIDAIGCQRDIAAKIIRRNGHYG